MTTDEIAKLTPWEKDKRIGKIVGVRPRLSFEISNDGGKSSSFHADTEREAEEFLKDTIRRFPDSWLKDHQVVTVEEWPRYHDDLNAMHEAELVFFGSCESNIWDYLRALGRVVSDGRTDLTESEVACLVFRATAAQRADAFLLTLG